MDSCCPLLVQTARLKDHRNLSRPIKAGLGVFIPNGMHARGSHENAPRRVGGMNARLGFKVGTGVGLQDLCANEFAPQRTGQTQMDTFLQGVSCSGSVWLSSA